MKENNLLPLDVELNIYHLLTPFSIPVDQYISRICYPDIPRKGRCIVLNEEDEYRLDAFHEVNNNITENDFTNNNESVSNYDSGNDILGGTIDFEGNYRCEDNLNRVNAIRRHFVSFA